MVHAKCAGVQVIVQHIITFIADVSTIANVVFDELMCVLYGELRGYA